MGKKNVYYLIARDQYTNEFDVIPVSSSRYASLEDIDLYTTCFENAKSLATFLIKEDHVPEDIDFFIVNLSKGKNKNKINIQEVLYQDSGKIREIANASKNGKLKAKQDEIDSLLDYFCFQMQHNQKFYEMVIYGKTNLYSKFTKYFIGKRFEESYSVKYKDGGWVMQSYSTLRNILESIARFKRKEDKEYLEERRKERELLTHSLEIITDPDYSPNQISFFTDVENVPNQCSMLKEWKEGKDERNGYQKNKRPREVE